MDAFAIAFFNGINAMQGATAVEAAIGIGFILGAMLGLIAHSIFEES